MRRLFYDKRLSGNQSKSCASCHQQNRAFTDGEQTPRGIHGNSTAFSPAALRGLQIISSEKAECFHCHGGFNFTDTSFHSQTIFEEIFYHSDGFYSNAHYAALPGNQQGLKEITTLKTDEGRFKAPSQEESDLIEFLMSLTYNTFLNSNQFSNPEVDIPSFGP